MATDVSPGRGNDPSQAGEVSRLEVDLYQLVDDDLLRANRADGTGWEWGWADWRRDWMDATPQRYAYRCLPLTIANQAGLWVRNPVGFAANWDGRPEPGSVAIRFDAAEEAWAPWVNSQFGAGIITWNTPLLIRTRPAGSRLMVAGPANVFKANLHPLTALIESDWMMMSFTMNWKILKPGREVRFEAGEPLFQAIPLARNLGADIEEAAVRQLRLDDDVAVARGYREWSEGRQDFHRSKESGDVRPDGWQKDYFQGRRVGIGTDGDVSGHMTKIRGPEIVMRPRPTEIEGRIKPTNGADTPTEVPIMPKDASMNGTAPSPSRRLPRKPLKRPRSLAEVVGPAPSGASSPAESVGPIALGDDWQSWIFENLLLGQGPESILAAMIHAGIDREVAAGELDRATRSPYLNGAERLRNRLRKRDWLLRTYRQLGRMQPSSGEVERRHQLTRDEFLRGYYAANRPVVITGMIDDWPALTRWGLDDFAARFGGRTIEVQVGRTTDARYEVDSNRFRAAMTMGEYVERLRTAGVTNDIYLTANNNSRNKELLPELWDDIRSIAEYLDPSQERAGFFWLGPAGTITPFHHDLTNNFMAQVLGRKRVKLVPAWDLPLMRNELHCYSTLDGGVMAAGTPPSLDLPQVIECVLNPGELLFLPIGCWHYVEALDVSATMSFTNFVFDNDFSKFYSTYYEV